MHTVLSSALLALALTGCATAGAPSSGGSGGDLNLISSEQLRQPELESRSAWEIIERLRPRWFQSRGSVFTSGQIFARVMVDGVPSGELNDLQSMSASGIEEMRYLNARDATTRFGTGYDGGVILVVTRRGTQAMTPTPSRRRGSM